VTPYAPARVPRPERVDLRGQETHVLVWGSTRAPRLFLLHGWMDVAASFQFLVDVLAREWCVIAPDLRGFRAHGLEQTDFASAL